MLNEAHLPPSNLMQVDFVETAIDASLFCMLGPAQLTHARRDIRSGSCFFEGFDVVEVMRSSKASFNSWRLRGFLVARTSTAHE
jgi:hypothetical protein